MFGNPTEIAILVGAAMLFFGANKLPQLARSMGVAKKEFLVGQAEADVAAEKARADARAQAEAAAAAAVQPGSAPEGTIPPTTTPSEQRH